MTDKSHFLLDGVLSHKSQDKGAHCLIKEEQHLLSKW